MTPIAKKRTAAASPTRSAAAESAVNVDTAQLEVLSQQAEGRSIKALRQARTDALNAARQAPTEALWHHRESSNPHLRQAVRDELITRHTPLVSAVATRLIRQLSDSAELGDLISTGTFGLIAAVERFDPERGFRFETYASQRIRGAIIDELRMLDWVPRSVRAKCRAYDIAHVELEQELRRKPTTAELAGKLEWSEAEVRDVVSQRSLSAIAQYDGMSNDDGPAFDVPDAASPAVHANIEDQERHELLSDALAEVREREQLVLKMYYFEGATLAQIGAVLGVTESRVSQIHSAAMRTLKDKLLSTGAFGD